MVNRLVSVGDDFNLPAAVNVVDGNLPDRLQDTALTATYGRKDLTVLNALDHGAVNTGAADTIAPINTALAALGTDPGAVYLPAGTYLLDNASPIVLKAGQSLIGSPGRTKLIRRNSGSYGAIRTSTNSTTTLTTLTADALPGATSLTVASSAGAVVGSYLQVHSNVLISAGANTTRGEMVLVSAVPDSTHITIQGGLRDTYLVADSAGVRNPNLQRDITLKDFIIESEAPLTSTSPLISIQNAQDLKIDGVTCRNSAGPGIVIDASVGFTITNYRCSNLQDNSGAGKFGYGINLQNNCEDGVIDGIVGDNVRHVFTTTGSPGGTVAGVPRNISVSNGVARSCPTTAGWDTHIEGADVTFSNCKTFGSYIGFQVRSPDTILNNVSADGCGIGILVTGPAHRTKIINPVITNTRSVSGQYESGNAIQIRGTGSPADVLIQGAIIDGCEQAPIKISRPDTGATGADPVNLRIIGTRAFDGGKSTSGRGVLWIEDVVTISNILMIDTIAANRTAAGKLKHLAEKTGTGAVDGIFMDAKLTGFIVKTAPFLNFTPTTVSNLGHTDAGHAPAIGRGIRKGANLYYGPEGSAGTLTPSANQLTLAPLDIDRVCTLNALVGEVTTAGSVGALLRLGIYADDGTGWFPGALIADAGTIDATVVAATALTLGTAVTLLPGRYWIGGASQGSPSTAPILRTVSPTGAVTMPLSAATPSAVANTGAAQNGVTGALPATFTTSYGVTSAVPRVLARLT